MRTAAIRVGVSGWRYEPWRGVFYPETLAHRLELKYASTVFRTLEINGSFYSLQRPESWRRWRDDAPEDFTFAVKGPRYITHMLKLRDFERPLANFLASGLLGLDAKLGPILWQFPPQLRFDEARFAAFLPKLPRTTAQALEIARRHDARMIGRSHLAIDEPRAMRHAVEIRHESFLDPRFVDLLRENQIALVIAETARRWPMPRDITADFMYLRLHGDQELYRSGYRPRAIARWAERIQAWHRGDEPADLPEGAVRVAAPAPRRAGGRDVYCYFDNTDVKLRAPADARNLMKLLGQQPGRWIGERRAPRTEAPRRKRALRSSASRGAAPARESIPARTPR